MVANDDLEGKTTHFSGFYTHTISRPNIPKPPIVREGLYRLTVYSTGVETKSVDFQNFVALLYAHMPVLRKKLK